MSSTTGIISGGIKWTGLASGTDFGAVVDQLVAIESRTITRQETWKAEWQEKITAISGLNTRLVSLKLDAQDKDLRNELLSRTSTVSTEGVVSVTNTSTAPLGSYEITVADKVNHKLISRSLEEDEEISYSSGDLVITIGDPDSPSKTFTLTAQNGGAVTAGSFRYGIGTSLDTLMEDINALTANDGIVASIQTDKDRNGVIYNRLLLTSTTAGKDYRINIKSDPTQLALGETYIDEPVKTTFLGSDVDIAIVDKTAYSGNVNKTFTFVSDTTGVLGDDEIVIQWADTEGHTGKFTLAKDGQDTQTVDIFQGLSITFSKTGNNGRFIKAESFSIDCQAPVLQMGQDSGLAQSEKLVHAGFVDQISAIQTGSSAKFVYTYQGVSHEVLVSDGMSLQLFADAINNASDNPGVMATIINDGTGTSTAYHLVLTGSDTGMESTITIEEPPTGYEFSSSLFDKDTFTKSREASNAMLKVDGFPAGDENWIQRKSNEVSDVVDGVVMTLTGEGETVLSVRNDTTAMKDKIVQLINSVNYCKSYILEYTKWGESNLVVSEDESGMVTTSREVANGIMIGNYGFQIAQSELDRMMISSVVPFPTDPSLTMKEKYEKRQQYLEDNGFVYFNLSEIGITSDPENQGLYKVDESKLLSCLTENPEAVIQLFTFSGEFPDKNSQGEDILVPIKGVALSLREKMTELTSETDNYDTDGTFVSKGKGILITLQENYQTIVENITAKIEREERRIALVKQRLTDKFNRLETSLQSLESQQSQLESSIESLNSDSS
ncbi:MAG: flagellar filament capping protein FliD [Deltaproteobacteria bacterium]|jgi:flagellar hook-associated protein 2|nr:flagellar filament capping protein FliD [Deltaproteobacteria bacterium]